VQKCTGDFCFGRKLYLSRAGSGRDIRMANRAAAGLRPLMLPWIFRRLMRGLPDFAICRTATVAMPVARAVPPSLRAPTAGRACWMGCCALRRFL